MNDDGRQRGSRRIGAHAEQLVECSVHHIDADADVHSVIVHNAVVHHVVRIRDFPVVARMGVIVHNVLRFAVTSRSRNFPSTTGAGPVAMSMARTTSSVTFTKARKVSFTKPDSIM